MARFDVFRTSDDAIVLDCQSDFLSHLQTRIVVPLLPPALEPKVAERLNPTFVIGGELHVLYPQFMAALPENNLIERITSLQDRDFEIIAALDILLSGF